MLCSVPTDGGRWNSLSYNYGGELNVEEQRLALAGMRRSSRGKKQNYLHVVHGGMKGTEVDNFFYVYVLTFLNANLSPIFT
jgi:hypothetical protein